RGVEPPDRQMAKRPWLRYARSVIHAAVRRASASESAATSTWGVILDISPSQSRLAAARVAYRGDRRRIIRRVEDVRAGHNGGCSGVPYLPGIRTAQSSIHLDHRIEPVFVAQAPHCTNFWQHLWQELLTAKARVDGHYQNDPTQLEHVIDRR